MISIKEFMNTKTILQKDLPTSTKCIDWYTMRPLQRSLLRFKEKNNLRNGNELGKSNSLRKTILNGKIYMNPFRNPGFQVWARNDIFPGRRRGTEGDL